MNIKYVERKKGSFKKYYQKGELPDISMGQGTQSASIVIASYNSWETLKFCLPAILQEAKQHNAETILVDSSTDGTERYAKEQFPDIRVIHLSERAFPDEAKMIGVSQARGELVTFIDADCTPGEGWIANKLQRYQQGELAMTGPVYCHPDCALIGWAYFFIEFSFFLKYTESQHMNRATGCNLAVPRNLFEEVRMPFTQSYGADAVFFSDLLKRGYRMYFDTASVVFHYYDSSLSDFLHHEFVHGRDAARLTQYKHRTQLWGLGYLLAGPILPFLKIFSIMNSLRQNRRYRVTKKFLAALPLTFCGAAAWTWGAWWGRLIRLFSSLPINRAPSSVS